MILLECRCTNYSITHTKTQMYASMRMSMKVCVFTGSGESERENWRKGSPEIGARTLHQSVTWCWIQQTQWQQETAQQVIELTEKKGNESFSLSLHPLSSTQSLTHHSLSLSFSLSPTHAHTNHTQTHLTLKLIRMHRLGQRDDREEEEEDKKDEQEAAAALAKKVSKGNITKLWKRFMANTVNTRCPRHGNH